MHNEDAGAGRAGYPDPLAGPAGNGQNRARVTIDRPRTSPSRWPGRWLGSGLGGAGSVDKFADGSGPA